MIAEAGGGKIAAFAAHNGQLLWQYPDRATLLTLGEQHIYLRTEGNQAQSSHLHPTIHTLDLSTGQQQWATNFVDSSLGLALERDHVAYIWGSQLHALDASTGKARWLHKVPVCGPRPIFAVEAEHVYLVDHESSRPGAILAYHKDTGDVAWRIDPGTSGEPFSWLQAANNVLVVAHAVRKGLQIEGRSQVDGAILWVWPDDPSLLRADLSWRFVVGDGIIFVPVLQRSQSGEGIAAIGVDNGKELWRVSLHIGAMTEMSIVPGD